MLRLHPFLLSARAGRWTWPFLAIGFALFATLVVLFGAPIGMIEAALRDAGRPAELAFVPGQWFGYAAFAGIGAAFIGAAALVIGVVHGQSPREAIGPGGRFSWGDFARAAGAGALLGVVATLWSAIADPGAVRLIPRGPEHAPWVALAAAALLVQTFGEEYAFKGYLARALGAVIPFRFAVIPILSVIFAAVHADNPDVRVDQAFMLIAVVATTALTYAIYFRTEDLGAVTGLHWINNFWAFAVVATAPVQSEALALAAHDDPVLAAGGTRLDDPSAYLELGLALAALWGLLAWRRSPFYLKPALRKADR